MSINANNKISNNLATMPVVVLDEGNRRRSIEHVASSPGDPSYWHDGVFP